MGLPYGYCGMPCALCSRYHTKGSSRCPGCSIDGYYTFMCRVHKCIRANKQIHCALCLKEPCSLLEKMNDFRDLDTDHVKEKNMILIKENGFDDWYEEYQKKAMLLTEALKEYNDGRMKRYLCELFIKNDMKDLEVIMTLASEVTGTTKEKASRFRNIAFDILSRKK